MFVCVNANAAIDKTVVVRNFTLDRIHRPEQVVQLPGGKGINGARALQTLGEQAHVVGWAAGYAGQFIAAGLQAEGLPAEWGWCPGESRTCLSIVDPLRGGVTELYESGPAVPAAQLEELRALVARLAPGAAFVTLTGSLPPGVPADFYADLARSAAAAGAPVALDCGGEALRLGLESGCLTLIKPNQAELEALLGRTFHNLEECRQAALDTSTRYGTLVVLSLGAQGAVAARAGETWLARPPALEVVSAVGSGDSLLAGLAQGLAQGLPLPEALRRGVAAGSANALSVGAGRFTRAEFEQVLAGVVCTG